MCLDLEKKRVLAHTLYKYMVFWIPIMDVIVEEYC